MAPIANQLRKAGFRVRETFDRIPPEAIVFCWGNGWAKDIRAVHPDVTVCVMDHGLFHPRKQTLVTGWQGLNGWGEHPVVDDGGQRLRAKNWSDNVKPWRKKGHYALILGQVYNDAAIVDAVEDYGNWLSARAADLRAEGWDVKFRPHPVQMRGNPERYPRDLGDVSRNPDLYSDLNEAGCVLAMNSNALLDAFLYGVQDVRLYNKGSMLYPISSEVSESSHERRPDPALREQLANRLAYCQWYPEEIEDGTWIELHAPIIERLIQGKPVQRWYEQRL